MKRLLIPLAILAIIAIGVYFFYVEEHRSEKNELVLYGNVDVRQVDLGFRVNGRVNALHFEEGDYVPQGSLMATLEDQPYLDLLKEAQASKEATQNSLKNSEQILLRRKELISDGSVSKEDYENALTSHEVFQANLQASNAAVGVADKNLTDTKLFSPSEGIILTRIRELGSVVNPSDPVYTLSLVTPVWIRAYVSEAELGNIFFGMVADIHLDTPEAPVYKGHIGFISPIAEFTPKTVQTTELRTDLVYRIRIYADNPDWRLKQGMPVTVRLDRTQRHPK